MTNLARVAPSSLLQGTRDLAVLGEEELRRFAAETARNRNGEALWALTEAHLTLHGSAGYRVSSHTLSAYRHAVESLLSDWLGENLLRPSRNAGVLWVRELEGRYKTTTVRVYLSGAKALYAALRWSGASEAVPFADVKVAKDCGICLGLRSGSSRASKVRRGASGDRSMFEWRAARRDRPDRPASPRR